MNVLIVYAHPEPRSLNGALRDFAVQHLEAAGHAVQVSDLYAMNWKPTLDADDMTERVRRAFRSLARFEARVRDGHAARRSRASSKS
jgi:putative NADPH-quinone reductase